MIKKFNQEDEKQPYKFTNQQLHGLAAEYYQKIYGHIQSVLSPDMDTIFNDKLAKNFSFTEFWKKPKHKHLMKKICRVRDLRNWIEKFH